jgi:hypothetical protein
VNPKLCALAAFLAVVCRAHVTLLPGWTVPVPFLVLAAVMALCAGLAWHLVRLARLDGGFRSSPAWRSAALITTGGLS